MVTQKPSGCLILTEGSGMKKIDEWFRLNESWCHSIRTLDIRSTLLYLGEPVDSTEKSGLQALARPTCPESLHFRPTSRTVKDNWHRACHSRHARGGPGPFFPIPFSTRKNAAIYTGSAQEAQGLPKL